MRGGEEMNEWEDLEAVLDQFELRRAEELEARRTAEQGEADFRNRCIEILETVAIPTFETAGRSLSKRAHECTASRRIADYDVPSADLTIRPYIPEEKWVRRSRLSMRCVCTEGFVVSGEICPPQKEPITMQATQRLDAVDETFVRKKVLEFVRAILDEY